MTSDSLQRGIRAKKEAYISQIIKGEGKIRVTELFGVFSKHFPGCAVRTFLNEYLIALEYRGEVVLSVEGNGYFAYDPKAYEKQQSKKE